MLKMKCLTAAMLALLVSSAHAEEKRESLDTSYISSDTAIVVVAHPQQILSRKHKLAVETDQMLMLFQAQSGIDANNLRQIVLQIGTDTRNEDQPNRFDDQALTGIFRFDKPVDADVLVATAFSGNKKEKHNDQTYYKPPSEHQPAVWFPDNRTMVVGVEWRVLKLIDEPNSMGLMVTRLRQADASDDLLLEVDIQQAEPLLLEMFRHFPEEEPFALQQTIKKLKRVTMTAKLTSDTPIRAQFQAIDAKSATELQVQGSALLKLAKEAWSKQKDLIQDRVDGKAKTLVEALVETLDTMLAGVRLTVNEDQFLVRVEKKGGAVDFIALFIGTVFTARESAVKGEVKDLERAREATKNAEEAAKRALEERKRAEQRKQSGR